MPFTFQKEGEVGKWSCRLSNFSFYNPFYNAKHVIQSFASKKNNSIKTIFGLTYFASLLSTAAAENVSSSTQAEEQLSTYFLIIPIAILGAVIYYLEKDNQSPNEFSPPEIISDRVSTSLEIVSESKESICEKKYQMLLDEIHHLDEKQQDHHEIKQLKNALNEFHQIVLCPISREIFSKPVTLSSGMTYDIAEIQQHLKVGTKCPVTNLVLSESSTSSLRPNVTLQQLIEFQLNQFEEKLTDIKKRLSAPEDIRKYTP